MKSILTFFLLLLFVVFWAPINFIWGQGKSLERLSDKENEAYVLYQQGHYKEACDLYISCSQNRKKDLTEQVLRGLVIFFLIDIIGILLFLYAEKRKAYRLLVEKNTAIAKLPVVNASIINFSESTSASKDSILLEALQKKLEIEKVYLDGDLTIESLSSELGTNRNILSKIINHHLGKTFPSLINQYRINEAIRMLGDPSNKKYTIEAVAQMCGYNNRQVFHNAFKKETGLTPISFRDVALSRD